MCVCVCVCVCVTFVFKLVFLPMLALPHFGVCLFIKYYLFVCMHNLVCVRLFWGLYIDLWPEYNKPSTKSED